MKTVKMLRFRQGYFHTEPLYEGALYELQNDVADYLIGLGVAEETSPKTEKAVATKGKGTK